MLNRKSFLFFQNGFIALMTTLVISFVLLSGALIINFEGFQIVSNVWQRHSKELSFSLAESCVDQAVVRVLQNPNYKTLEDGEVVNIGGFFCSIKEVVRNGSKFTIKTEAEIYKSITSLEAIFDKEILEISSFKEM